MLGTVAARATSESVPSPQTPCSAYASVQISTASKISEETRFVTTNRCLQNGFQRLTLATIRGGSRSIGISGFSAGSGSAIFLFIKAKLPLLFRLTGSHSRLGVISGYSSNELSEGVLPFREVNIFP
jgi:hypothetical protein